MGVLLMPHGIEPNFDHVARMPAALESATLANAVALRECGMSCRVIVTCSPPSRCRLGASSPC